MNINAYQWAYVIAQTYFKTRCLMADLEYVQAMLLVYPDFYKPFDVYTDARHSQLGALICQNGKPIAF
jgi:hypothetical protein